MKSTKCPKCGRWKGAKCMRCEPVTHKVFVYGTLKRGYSNNRVMERAGGKFIGAAITRDQFAMVHVGIPYVFRSDNEPRGRIVGEVYEVPHWGLAELDMLEGYRGGRGAHNHYDREQIQVLLHAPDTPEQIDCYIYLCANPSRLQPRPDLRVLPEHGSIEWTGRTTNVVGNAKEAANY